jgi:bifunctional non-homologous end joining protein LigD
MSGAPALASVELMLASHARPFDRAGWIFELKYDGFRILATKGQLLTRNKKDATTWYPELVTALSGIRGNFIVDAEACILNEKGIPQFEQMRARTKPKGKGASVTLFVFDLLYINGRDLRPVPLIDRKERLRRLLPASHPRVRYVDYLETHGKDLYRDAVAIGMEGTLGKQADAAYVGGRTELWLKSKPAGFHDLGWKRLPKS